MSPQFTIYSLVFTGFRIICDLNKQLRLLVTPFKFQWELVALFCLCPSEKGITSREKCCAKQGWPAESWSWRESMGIRRLLTTSSRYAYNSCSEFYATHFYRLTFHSVFFKIHCQQFMVHRLRVGDATWTRVLRESSAIHDLSSL